MDSMCHVCLKKLSDESTGLMDAIVPDGFIVVLEWGHNIYDVLWNIQFGKPHNVPQRFITLDGHHARKDGTLDANGSTVSHKSYESLSFEKELSDDEISTSIHLKEISSHLLFRSCKIKTGNQDMIKAFSTIVNLTRVLTKYYKNKCLIITC